MIYKVSTTGAVSEVVLWDMGARTLTHPTVELDLGLEYTDDELIDSADLATAISNGWITLDEKSGGAVTEEEAIEIATETANTTVSGAVGGETATFLGLTDTPDTNPGYSYYYAVSSASGVEWKSDYLDGEIHISAEYDGDANGSATSPFNTIPEAAAFAYATYSGTGKKVAVIIHPGEYEISSPIDLALPEIEAFIGTDKKTVVLKPTAGMAGQPLIRVYKPLYARSITLDATDYPEFITTDQTAGIAILNQYPFTTIDIEDMDIKGFRAGMYSQIPAFVNAKHITIENTYIGICMSSGTVFTIDSPIIRGARERHLCVKSGSKAYVKGGFLSSTGVPGATNSGIALRAEGEDSKLEFYGGGSVTNVAKHVEVVDGGTVVVDGAILKEIENSPAITQDATSFLTITNSIAPLEADKLEINNPAGCNIFAYDSSVESLSIGTGDDVDQTLLTIIEGSSDRPSFDYKANYGPVGRKALVWESSKEGFQGAIAARSNNANAGVGAHTAGTDGYDYEANFGLAGFENDIPKGWQLVKKPGETPNFAIQTVGSGVTPALNIDYDNYFSLETGVAVNKILSEDDFVSGDYEALATQGSIGTYINDYTYSKLESDGKYLFQDGTTPLTGDWDAGDYIVTASGFAVGNARVDHAIFAEATGLLTGGNLTVNAGDDTLLDVEAGTALYVDMSDRSNPVIEIISWPAQTWDPELAGGITKWIGVERTAPGVGSLTAAHRFTQSQKRTTVVIGRIWNFDEGDDIKGVGQYKHGAFNTGKTVSDIAYTLGSLNISGNSFTATASGVLRLNRSAGEAFRYTANYVNNETSPNIYISTTVSGISNYSYHIQGGSAENKAYIEPGFYDLNGTKTAVPTDKWTVQRVYYYPVSNVVLVTYGQYLYDTYEDAVTAAPSENLMLNTETIEGSILRAFLVLKEGCTDLTDTDQATILEATQLGSGGSSGGATSHGSLLELTADDHPQYIRVDGTRGFTSTVSGITPVQENDLATKSYVDDEIDNLTTDHGELTGLADDDHPQYLRADGTRQLTADWDVGPYEIEADGYNIDDVELDLAGYTNITGILTGGTLSINTVDNAILDIAAGTGIFVDMTDRDNPVVETVTWTATTINPNLTGLRSKWIGMQRTAPGTVTPISATNFTQLEKRSIIILGRCWGNGTATITGRGNYKAGAFSFGKSMQDIAYALGSINITGNDFSATASGSLTLDRSAGESFRFMANYGNENISPNISKSTTASGIDKYSYHIQGQLFVNSETELDPDNYDLNGVKTAMPADKWQTQFVYYFPVSNTTHVIYGQHYHDDLDEAYEHLRSGESSYVLNTSILEGSILRSAIILKTGCDDLTDENQAKIIPITDSQFGSAGGGGGGVEDHGQLTGLLDDDHPQYHNDVRGDARYYTQAQVDTISGTITEEWINKDSAVVQVRRTTDYTPGTSWDDITFDALDVESDSDVLEWDEVNTDRLLVKLDGLYEISYSFPVRTVTTTTEIYARVMVDDTTQLDGSYTNQDLYQNETHQQDRTFRCYLSAGEYVTLQISTAAANHTVQGNAMISIAKLDGVPGPSGADGAQGPPGQDGVLTISGAADYFYGYDGAGTTQLATGSYTDIPHTTGYTTAAFSSNGTEVTIEQDNTFVITGRFTVRQTSSARSEAWMRLVVDQGGGYTEIPGTFGACYSRNSSQDKTTATATAVLDLVEGDKIKLQAQNNSGGGTMFGMQNGSSLQIFTTKGQTGPQGPSGPAGADGSDGADGADGVDAGGTLALLQARRTTTYSDIPTSWTDLTFDTTDLEYDDTVIEHDDTDRDRFQIKKDSYYYIAVNFSVDDETTVRIRKNDTTVLPGSTRPVGNTADANDMVSALQNACIAQLDSGDYVTVQIQSTTSAETLYADATFIIFDMVGAKGADGAPGPAGSGSTINLKDEGSSVTNTPHSILNFTGDAVTVSDAGSGEATINITGGSNGVVVQEEGGTVTGGPHTTLNFVGSNITASNAGSGVATITTTAPVFGTEFATGGEEGETNTNSTTGTEKAALAVTGIPAGTYRFGWYYEWRRNTTSNDYRALIELDGTTTIMDHREESQDVNSWHIEGGFYNVTLGAGNHTFSFQHYGESSGNTSYTRRLRMEIWRVA
jgi:hypothetical protein